MNSICRPKIFGEVFVLTLTLLLLMLLYSNMDGVFPVRSVEASGTWTVDDDGSADYSQIQQAIDHAGHGDTIMVRSGTYREHLIVDKSLSIMGEDQMDTIIDGDGMGRVITTVSDNISIAGFTIRNGEGGVVLGSNGNNLKECTMEDNAVAVLLDKDCEGNNVSHNQVLFSSTSGIYGDRCGRNAIADNNISFNVWHGVFLYGSQPCLLDGNSVLSNKRGLFIRYSSNNTVTRNVLSNNEMGVYIYSDEDPIRPSGVAKYNVIGDNTVQNNSVGILMRHQDTIAEIAENRVYGNLIAYNDIGLNVSGLNGNSIYNNAFVGNREQVSLSESFNNSWDGGYYIGGNYWSDHNGTDICWGLSQNETGSDGIIDSPYQLTSNPVEEDRYPFFRKNEWLNPLEIDILCPSNATYRLNSLPLTFTLNKPAQLIYSLDNQPNVTISKSLVLANLSIGVHEMILYANDVLGNHLERKVVFTVTYLGDLSLDGSVDIIDVAIVAHSYGHRPGGDRWNPDADLNNDYVIDIIDIATVAKQYGKKL